MPPSSLFLLQAPPIFLPFFVPKFIGTDIPDVGSPDKVPSVGKEVRELLRGPGGEYTTFPCGGPVVHLVGDGVAECRVVKGPDAGALSARCRTAGLDAHGKLGGAPESNDEEDAEGCSAIQSSEREVVSAA